MGDKELYQEPHLLSPQPLCLAGWSWPFFRPCQGQFLFLSQGSRQVTDSQFLAGTTPCLFVFFFPWRQINGTAIPPALPFFQQPLALSPLCGVLPYFRWLGAGFMTPLDPAPKVFNKTALSLPSCVFLCQVVFPKKHWSQSAKKDSMPFSPNLSFFSNVLTLGISILLR